jgi:DnaJ-class molecular chaperone
MFKQSASNPAYVPTISGKRTAVVTERRCSCCGGAGESVAGAVCGACQGAGVVSVRNR